MPKVLLIDDDSTLADAITERLADCGFVVEWSSSGIEGLDKARSGRPDVVIIDRIWSDMDGVMVIEALRKTHLRMPVLVLSALDTVEERVRGLNMGGDDYLAKPFAVAELPGSRRCYAELCKQLKSSCGSDRSSLTGSSGRSSAAAARSSCNPASSPCSNT
jgi:DNA-binding response OmpR family regulator